MTILIIRIMFALGVVGYAVNMYCDRILSIFPNGTIKLDEPIFKFSIDLIFE